MTSQEIVGEMSCQCAMKGFRWRVEHFSSLSEKYYDSPTIRFWGRNWCLRLFPNIQSKEDMQGYVALYPMAMEEWDPPPSFEFKLAILTADRMTYDLAADIRTFDEIGHKIAATNAIRRCELFLEKEKFLPDDVLTIVPTFTNYDPQMVEGIEDASVQTEVQDTSPHDESERMQIVEKTGGELVLEDIGNLWRRGDDSDVVVRVGNVELKAHRAILGVRSPTLCTYIHHDPAMRNSGVLTITDYGPDVVEELLNYIYTGTPRELTVERAFVLYRMAHEYSVGDLKRQCSRFLQDNLCVDTFCNTFSLALNRGDSELLDQCTDFFVANYRLIVGSIQWQSFKRNRPLEVRDLFNRAELPLEDLD